MNFSLTLASFFVGIVVGLTGVGGATLITPLLIFVFHIPASIAIGSDVMSATLMKVIGGMKHYRQHTVNLQIVRWLLTGSVPGSILGIFLLYLAKIFKVQNLDSILIRTVGIVMLLVASLALLRLALKFFAPKWKLPKQPRIDLSTQAGKNQTIAIAAVLGCILGLTSVGSGSLFALVLIVLFRMNPHKLVGTDIVHAAILLIITALGHFSLGTVNWSIVFPIWLGTIPGVLVGAQLCKHVPKLALQFGLYTILVNVGWQLITHA